MTVIKVSCPDCGKIISIEVSTIDKLRLQLMNVSHERDIYKQKLDALEQMNKSNPFAAMFGGGR